jgi:hypothetical protein
MSGLMSTSEYSSGATALRDSELDDVARNTIHAWKMIVSIGDIIDGMTDPDLRYLRITLF